MRRRERERGVSARHYGRRSSGMSSGRLMCKREDAEESPLLQARASAWQLSSPSSTLREPRGDSLYWSPGLEDAASWARSQSPLDLHPPRLQYPSCHDIAPAAAPLGETKCPARSERRRPAGLQGLADWAALGRAIDATRSPLPRSSLGSPGTSRVGGSRSAREDPEQRGELGGRARSPDLIVLPDAPRSKPVSIPRPSTHDRRRDESWSPLPAGQLDSDDALLFRLDW